MVDRVSEQMDMIWDSLIREFTDICRKIEHLADRELSTVLKARAFKRGLKCARKINKIKKTRYDYWSLKSKNAYDAHKCYESLGSEKPSVGNLANQISKTQLGNAEKALEGYKAYLKTYFGIEYKRNLPPKQKYQTLQLLLILYRCAQGKRGILENMQAASFWRFRNEEDNPYSKYMLFMRGELLKALDLKDAFAIEYFAGSFRFCINSLPQAITRRVTDALKPSVFTSCHWREIRDDLYEEILSNIKDLNVQESVIREPDDLFQRAYIHFSLLGIEDTIVEPRLKLLLDDFYTENKLSGFTHCRYVIAQRVYKSKLNNSCLQDNAKDEIKVHYFGRIDTVTTFIKTYSLFLAKFLLKGKITARDVERHESKYCKLAALFLCYNFKKTSFVLELNELLHITIKEQIRVQIIPNIKR